MQFIDKININIEITYDHDKSDVIWNDFLLVSSWYTIINKILCNFCNS